MIAMLLTAATQAITMSVAQPIPTSPDQAKATVTRFLEAISAGDDEAYNSLASRMEVVVAPGRSEHFDRAKFAQRINGCGAFQVQKVSAVNQGELQAVSLYAECVGASGAPAQTMRMTLVASAKRIEFTDFSGWMFK